LGPNDKVRVTVFNEDRLSGVFTVDAQGLISMPLIGQIEAQGLSTEELAESVRASLAGRFILNPRVAAEVASFRPFFIIGEVSEPGEYEFVAGLTVLSAIATAKGFTFRANKRSALLLREGYDGPIRVNINDDILIEPGDVITIQESWF
jgi:polysaccharide export outer membrane protein